jgi:hypothetical protein
MGETAGLRMTAERVRLALRDEGWGRWSMSEDHDFGARLAEFNAKADKLVEAERVLVMQSHDDESIRRDMLARYDAALAAHDKAGIAAYNTEVKELQNRAIARHAALAKVRADYDALERQLLRPPRRTWRQLLGLK